AEAGVDPAQYAVIAVSIDPAEAPHQAARAERALDAGPSWHFLSGGAAAIAELAQAVGFHYRYDASLHQYVHPAGIVIVTADGRVARYFLGVDFPPGELRGSLLEAAHDRIGSPVERLLLFCFHYDPATGKYSATIATIARVIGALGALGLGSLIVILRRREGRAHVEVDR